MTPTKTRDIRYWRDRAEKAEAALLEITSALREATAELQKAGKFIASIEGEGE